MSKQKLRMTIKNRLILAILALLIIPSAAIGYFSYNKASAEVETQLIDSASNSADNAADQVTDLLNTSKTTVDWLAKNATAADLASGDTAKIRNVVDPLKAVHSEYESVFYATSSGTFIISPDKKMDAGFDPRTRPWYSLSMNNKGKSVINEPIVSADEKKTVTVIVSKTTDDGSGVVGVTLDLSQVKTKLANIQVGAKGYTFILDKNRKYLVHPNQPLLSEDTESYINEMYSKDSGVVSYIYKGVPKKAVFLTNKETGWKMIAAVEMSEVTTAMRSILYNTLIVVGISILLGLLLAFWLINSITKPLNRAIMATNKIADGDLTEELAITSNDELADLSRSMNSMVTKLRGLILGVVDSSQSVAGAAQQISATTQEIASSSTTQAESAQMMQELFGELTTAIGSVAKSAEESAELASKTTQIAVEGGNVVRGSVESMTQVNEQMALLESDSNKIGDIIEVISDIADQTNLLALNAAIEAARAGEQGRGFAVVADEVRKLAERSGEATKQITSIIKVMQENTRRSVSAVAAGVTQSRETGKAFGEIVDMVKQTESRVAEIAAASEEQSAQTNEVMQSIENISSTSQNGAAAAEETAATSQSLAQLADDLNRAVSVFKV